MMISIQVVKTALPIGNAMSVRNTVTQYLVQ